MNRRQSKNNVDYTALLNKAKLMSAEVEKARYYSCDCQITHKHPKTCEAASNVFHALEKEYKKWIKENIEKHGFILKIAGDKHEPIGILQVLAGTYDAKLECVNGQLVVASH